MKPLVADWRPTFSTREIKVGSRSHVCVTVQTFSNFSIALKLKPQSELKDDEVGVDLHRRDPVGTTLQDDSAKITARLAAPSC